MTRAELNYIKDAFSQIIDDIAGNPDWHEAARAVASDLGTLERKLEEKISPLPSNLDEAAREYLREYNESEFGNGGDDWDDDIFITFKAGAEWMAGQGVKFDTKISWLDGFGFQIGWPEDTSIFDCFNEGDRVVVQIRKK